MERSSPRPRCLGPMGTWDICLHLAQTSSCFDIKEISPGSSKKQRGPWPQDGSRNSSMACSSSPGLNPRPAVMDFPYSRQRTKSFVVWRKFSHFSIRRTTLVFQGGSTKTEGSGVHTLGPRHTVFPQRDTGTP